jgi:uncharacterized membrane protein required for colicin V production
MKALLTEVLIGSSMPAAQRDLGFRFGTLLMVLPFRSVILWVLSLLGIVALPAGRKSPAIRG